VHKWSPLDKVEAVSEAIVAAAERILSHRAILGQTQKWESVHLKRDKNIS